MGKLSTASKKTDPFKTKKNKTPTEKSNDTITPPAEIAQAIDSFREAQDQYKHFEGEMTIHKDEIMNFSSKEYAMRVLNGLKSSFKILGDESMVTYVAMDSSAGLTEEDVAEFEQRWGKKAADELIVRDFGSVRFDAAVLEANYDAVVEALQGLPDGVLQHLFKPMLMKAKSGAVDLAKSHAKTPEEMKEILQNLKMKNYIR